jgi:CBS domain-containing protein
LQANRARFLHWQDLERELEETMQVRELMTKVVTMIDSSATLVEAAELMREEDVGVLPVGDSGRPIGMLTDRDIVIRALADDKDPANTSVREVLTPRVTTIYEDRDVGEAAELMAKDQVRRLLVVDHQQNPVGIISLGDLGRSDVASTEGVHALKGVTDALEREHSWQSPTRT